MKNHFFAVIGRMKNIARWGLMRNTQPENLQEHSFQVAVLAHALATLDKTDRGVDVDPDRAAALALFHDASEILTGDLPTPVKYYSADLTEAYRRIERRANALLLEKLPERLRGAYEPLLAGDDAPERPYVKAADTLSAYLKCVEELKAGNGEFHTAAEALRKKLDRNPLPCVKTFLDEFAQSYGLTLDDQISL